MDTWHSTKIPGAELRPMRVDPIEAAHLEWLLDGALTDPTVEAALRSAWGLCPRHAWALAALEAELTRGVAYDTTALHAHLIERAERSAFGSDVAMAAPLRRRLGSDAGCLTCEHVKGEHSPATGPLRPTDSFPRFTGILGEAASALPRVACPACLDGEGPMCRPHLLAGVIPARGLAAQLGDLARRLAAIRDNLAADAHVLRGLEAVAWIEGLGWLAGWGFVRLLPSSDAGDEKRESNGRVPDTVMEH